MPVNRYPRPALEIEYSREALTQEGCCRYVPVVVRLCGVPEHLGARLTATFERVRKLQGGSTAQDYVRSLSLPGLQPFPNYREYRVELLARGDGEETGTIHLEMLSRPGGQLSEAVYRLDHRQEAPVQHTLLKGSFIAIRLLPFLRSVEERDALYGQFPPSGRSSTPIEVSSERDRPTLFSLS